MLNEIFLIRNSDRRFGCILEVIFDDFSSEFKVFHIDSEGKNYIVVPILEGYYVPNGCTNLSYSNDGHFHFCDIDDIVCINKSLQFAIELTNARIGDENADKWALFKDGISVYNENYSIKE